MDRRDLCFESLKTTLGHGFESHHLHRYPGGGVMLPPAFCFQGLQFRITCHYYSLSAHLFKRAWESWSAMRDRRRGNSERGRFRQVRGKDRMNGSGKCHTCHPCFEQIAKKSGMNLWNEPKSEESRNKLLDITWIFWYNQYGCLEDRSDKSLGKEWPKRWKSPNRSILPVLRISWTGTPSPAGGIISSSFHTAHDRSCRRYGRAQLFSQGNQPCFRPLGN